MSQITDELGSIASTRKLIAKKHSDGTMGDLDFYETDLRYLKASATRINGVINLLVSAAKHGKSITTSADRINLLDRSQAINTGDSEIEMVKCPDRERLITRASCLDYSGTHRGCDSCSTGKDTKSALL